jgi:subtilisin family serine protease
MSMRRTAGLVAGILLCTPLAATAQETPTGVVIGTWFVELASPPAADGSSLTTLNKEKNSFRSAAKAAKLQFKERYAYSHLFNGLSIQINPRDLTKLSRIPGIKALWPVVEATTELDTAVSMTGADIAQSSLGYTGDGVRVGVIDTGIDYHHPDLGGCFGPGCRVAVGHDFVGNAFTGGNTPVPDADPDDCAGHGTHVAGIVGANGAVVGVAPGVTYGAYRVFGCTGSTNTDIMAAAMERAYLDGMDIVNMSIGSTGQWPQYPSAAAATKLVDKGVVVVTSIGNAGTSTTTSGGLWAASAPGVGKKVIGTASFDNTASQNAAFDVNGNLISYNLATAAPPPPTSGSATIVSTGTPATTNDACNAVAPAPGSLTGVIALIRRGTCGFYEKAFNAQAAGAIAVVLYNNAPGALNPTVAGSPAITIPVVAINDVDGAFVHNQADPTTLTWGFTESTAVATAGLISSFSSFGTSPDLELKPDIGAPGGFIWSTYPIELGSYANLSGTSMASPHVAGAAALFLEAHPNTPSQAMDVWLQNSADPHLWSGNPGLGALDHAHRQGAGMLDIDDSILATVKIEPSDLGLGEGEFGPITRMLTVTNEGGDDVTLDLSWESAVGTFGDILPILFFFSDETIEFTSDGVTPISSVFVPAGGSAPVYVTVTPSTFNDPYFLYNGYIFLTTQGGGPSYTVPYVGVEGDYQGMEVWPGGAITAGGRDPFTTNLLGYPNLDSSFTFVGTDAPQFWVHIRHQVRRLRFEVRAAGGKSWHRVFPDFQYLGRSATTSTYYTFNWDGTSTNGKKVYLLPDGNYEVTISVLKALGDDSNPAHWESVTLPVTIDRP